ncbi:MAG: hypothetical protein M3232_02245, partial [Thermoproteota archaeon]|nr:hypothetical protein [Thermoproteota archaeon]
SYTGFNLSMPIAQSKRKLIAATALFIAVGALTGAIATQGAATISFAQTDTTGGGGGGATTGGGGGGATTGGGERIVRQGTITSMQDPLPGHEGHQAAVILPLRQDGSVYSGVITYTASEPVEVVVPQVVTLNASQQAVLNGTDSAFGTLVTSPLDNRTSLAISIITPPYGDTPIPSASIPFTGNALWLHTLSGTPFIASYAVSAQVLPAQVQNNVSTAPPTTAEEGGDEDGGATDGGGGDEAAEGGAA